MKPPHEIFLRILQILTMTSAGIGVVMLLVMFDVVPLKKKNAAPDISPATGTQISAPAKVKRRATARDPNFEELLNEADRLAYVGKTEAALTSYQKASTLQPRDWLPYEKMGELHFAQKKYQSAVENFQLVQSMNPSHPLIQMKIVRSLIGLRKIMEAKTKLDTTAPDSQESLYYKGLVAAFYNDQNAAKDLLAKSIAAGSNEPIKKGAKKVLDVYRDFDLAREAPAEFLQTMLAEAFDQGEASGLAIEIAYQAVKRKYDYRDAWLILGHALLNEHQWLDAEDAFGKAVSLDSSHSAGFFFRGVARRYLKKSAEAAADLEEAMKLGAQPLILTKFMLAEAYFENKNFVKAFPLYKDVVMTDSSDIRQFIRPMALAIINLQKPAEALALAQKAVETHPKTAMAENLLGWAYMAMNDFGKAREHLEEALRRDPELAAAHLNLGQLSEKLGRNADAISSYEKAIVLAQKSGEDSILQTATERYNALKIQMPAVSPVAPQAPSIPFIPSLSLE